MGKVPKVYLASGWFNPAQKKQMEEIYGVLSDFKKNGLIELFAPFYDGIVLKKDDPNLRQKMREVWNLDIQKLSESDVVVASTQDHDVGTIFECGYASRCGISIICYNSNVELGLNVMLAQEAKGFVKSPVALEDAILSFKRAFDDGVQPSWRFNLWQGEPI